ncbi:transposase [Kitasatospora sp. NPDC059599]|uniref:transposase n=1 Tax=Kitasatospora sp. NPDC059599 TaxID=3346880 RepID=UPI003677DFF7
MAALDVRTGEVLTEVIRRNDAATFTAFLDQLDLAIPPGKEIHVVLDNGSSHTARHTETWPAAHPRWHVRWPRRTHPGSTRSSSSSPPSPAESCGTAIRQPRRPDRQAGDLRDRAQRDRQALPVDLRRQPAQSRMSPAAVGRNPH